MDKKDIELVCGLMPEWHFSQIKIKKAGGQTNKNWIVEYNGKKYFVRIPWERNDIINRKIEAKNILALSHNKKLKSILPRYFLFVYKGRNILQSKSKKIFHAPDGTMIAEYISGKTFTPSFFKKKEYQLRLAEMFHIFHTSGIVFANKYDVFKDEIEKYRLAALKYPIHKIVGKEIVAKMEELEREAKEYIPFLKKGVSTHNDFIFQNFLIGENGKIYLLDFEYAGLNQRGGIIYDFGFLFVDNLFRKPKITSKLFEEFLSMADEVYGQRFNRKKIYWASMAAILVMFWWGLVRYFSVKNKKEKKYFKDYVLRRSNGIDYIFSFLQEKRD